MIILGLTFLYLVSASAILGIAAWMIIQVRRIDMSGWLVGSLVAIPFSILSMIKLRCTVDSFPCGFMSFSGGFTWHLFPGLIGILTLWAVSSAVFNRFRSHGWSNWMEHLGRLVAPLLGLWVAVLWEVLPVEVIHPPTHGGPCPSIPVICHDTPLLGHGGLMYWPAPFILWLAVCMMRDNKLSQYEKQL
jgi:hypothetical protein